MARNISIIETHPQRQEIINALLAGSKLSQIAAWATPAVSTAAICRFRLNALRNTHGAFAALDKVIANKDKELAPAVTRVEMATAIDPFTQAALRSAARHERWMDDLEQSPDLETYKVMATIDRNNLATQRYQAELAGRLDAGSGNTTNNLSIALMLPRGPGDAQSDTHAQLGTGTGGPGVVIDGKLIE